MLTRTMALQLASVGLGHVRRPYPHKLDHVLEEEEAVEQPGALHPIFFGSFDWHSCVHGYWMLARLLRRFPALPAAPAIRALFDESLSPARVEGECAYFARPSARGFERPYGWAWLLALAAELGRQTDPVWAAALAPLTDTIVARFRTFLPLADYPVRAGTHGNTAFALRLAADYADAAGEGGFLALLQDTAARWYAADRGCQAWEPSGDDFLSPALIEAECMRRLMPADRFARWFSAFLPQLAAGEPATLFRPVAASDRTDGKLAHLDGLNLSRAWCWRALLYAQPEDGAWRARGEAAIVAHLEASLPALTAHYMGEHWLASFALLALDGLSP